MDAFTGPARANDRLPHWSPLALLVAAFAIRAWDFGNPIVHVDEQWYLLVGDRMLAGAVPYLDLWDRKPVGLFLLFAGLRWLGGDGILAYQIAATLCAAATAWLVSRAARRIGAAPAGAFAAGLAYLVWLPLLSGRGGQSPVFYNLPMTAAALLTVELPRRAAAADRLGIVASGTLACLLAGVAIQIKYTPFVEGAFFGLAHLVYLRRAGARVTTAGAAGAAWIALGLAPTLAAIVAYAARGSAALDAFWFANVTSILLRPPQPALKIALRLLGTWAQFLPLVAGAVATWRAGPRREPLLLAGLWLASALGGYALIGGFYDHYALPLVAPLAVLAAPTLGRRRRALAATLAIGLAILAVKTAARPREGDGIRSLAATVARESHGGCPYVFAGDSVVYLLARACVPTRYAFPSTLAYAAEAGAIGVDQAAEVRRILAGRPPVIVTLDRPLAPWSPAPIALVRQALARDYRLVAVAPREGGHELVYARGTARLTPPSASPRLAR